MAIKISKECTVYEEPSMALRVAEWRGQTPGGELLVKSDDFSIADYDYPKICESARMRFCKQWAMADPVNAAPVCNLNVLPLATPNDLDAEDLPIRQPMMLPLGFKFTDLAIPALVTGVIIFGLIYLKSK